MAHLLIPIELEVAEIMQILPTEEAPIVVDPSPKNQSKIQTEETLVEMSDQWFPKINVEIVKFIILLGMKKMKNQ